MSEEEKTYSGTKKEKKINKVSPVRDKKVTVTFRENRKFYLHIGREMTIFKGKESKQIPEEWTRHKDWASVQKYFNVKGV